MTIDPARALLDQLDTARTKTTPGPWTAATAPHSEGDETHAEYLTSALRPDEGHPLWVVWAPAVEGLHTDVAYVVPVVTGDGPASEDNARFVSLAHGALPQLVAALRAMLDLADQLDRDAENTPIGYLTVYARSAADHIRAAVTDALTPKPPT